ncbi:GDSL esterase/lipase CPRD49-like isoform X2 [Solanum verrucosum]|uniref:GDSL esterase/lipase CPRD49-like isoform X2 n=1 Tax=Solanum verrucosum TaxID=315347 RepID=UPI0020D0D260|nr:GDSL esterase/lipase CPRD49-like isoform X2 [Solanum verrucosum]
MVGPNRPQIVLFGSSIVQFSYSHEGWGSILTDLYSCKADIVLRGYGGWNTRLALQVLDQIFPKSLSEKTRILVLSTPPVNEEQIIKLFGSSRRSNESSHIYSEACIKMCKELGIKVIDLWTALQNRDDWLTAHFTDGVHLTAEASKVVVKEILKVVKEADWEPNLHWKSLPNEFAQYSPTIFVGPNGNTPVIVADLDLDWQAQWI